MHESTSPRDNPIDEPGVDEAVSDATSSDRTRSHQREELSFRSGGADLAATLYRPATPAGSAVPCVVLAAGLSMTRHDGFPRFAERFALAGFAALTFDFRHLGDSDGEPRQLIDVKRQRADLAAAIAFARTLHGVDPGRVALWGYSLGGAHAVHVAAHDDQIAAAVALCPPVDGLAVTLAGDVRNNLRMIPAAGRALLTRRPVRMPLTGPPGKLTMFTQPEAGPGFEAVRGEGSRWRNEILGKPSQHPALFRPIRAARRVRCPLLVGLGTTDQMVPARPIERLAARAPAGELHHYPGAHFDCFLDHFDEVADRQVTFLTRHLRS